MHLMRIATGLALAAALVSPGAAQNAPSVEAARPLVREIVDYDIFTGRFEAVRDVELRARVTGYLDKVSFEDGDIVEEGRVLFTIDRRTFEAAVARAEAALAAAKATLLLTELEFRRAEQLAERNVGSEQDVDRTRAALAQAAAQADVASADLRQAQLDLAFTEVRAPFTGRMSDRKVDPGNLVVGGASNATLLSTIVSIDPIQIVFTGSEADFLRYSRRFIAAPGTSPSERETKVGIRLMDEEDFSRTGVIDFVNNVLDPNSGTITVRAIVENADGFLTPGVFGRVEVPATEPYQGLLIPDAAIQSDQSTKIVMLVDGAGKVSPRPVKLGDMHRGLRVVKSGLSPDDMVIVNGTQRARPGGTVAAEIVELTLGEE